MAIVRLLGMGDGYELNCVGPSAFTLKSNLPVLDNHSLVHEANWRLYENKNERRIQVEICGTPPLDQEFVKYTFGLGSFGTIAPQKDQNKMVLRPLQDDPLTIEMLLHPISFAKFAITLDEFVLKRYLQFVEGYWLDATVDTVERASANDVAGGAGAQLLPDVPPEPNSQLDQVVPDVSNAPPRNETLSDGASTGHQSSDGSSSSSSELFSSEESNHSNSSSV